MSLAWGIEMIAENILVPGFFQRLVSMFFSQEHKQSYREKQAYEANAPVQLHFIFRELFHQIAAGCIIHLQQGKRIVHKMKEDAVPQIAGDMENAAQRQSQCENGQELVKAQVKQGKEGR